jgi:hypothetical protein
MVHLAQLNNVGLLQALHREELARFLVFGEEYAPKRPYNHK